METLEACRVILQYVGLTDKAYVLIVRWQISRGYIRVFLICILTMDSIMQFWACAKSHHINIHTALLSLHIALSTLSGVAIYGNLVIKTKEILELMAYLTDVFDKRNFSIAFFIELSNCS